MTRQLPLLLAGAIAAVGHATTALALPTMIRLGYSDCATCHLAPQGGGPLKTYGKGIDQAQSLRGGEYRPRDSKLVRTLSWHGHIAQDLRLTAPLRWTWPAHESSDTSFQARLQYRNYTQLPGGFAAHVSVTGESESVRRPDLTYDPSARASPVFVNLALLRYKPRPSLEFAVGRDQLPTGINVPDPRLFIKSRERAGYYDTPTQLKMYWAGTRHRITPYIYGPGGNEPDGEGESGGGGLAEFDVLDSHRAVVGINVLRGGSTNGHRRLLAGYARVGFGPWGILVQHGVTSRERSNVSGWFRQQASYAQVFWAPKEWLVASALAERLSVRQPFEERRNAGGVEIVARLTSMATIGANARIERDLLTHEWSKSLAFQFAFKTVY